MALVTVIYWGHSFKMSLSHPLGVAANILRIIPLNKSHSIKWVPLLTIWGLLAGGTIVVIGHSILILRTPEPQGKVLHCL